MHANVHTHIHIGIYDYLAISYVLDASDYKAPKENKGMKNN